jgi:hypothetical protein
MNKSNYPVIALLIAVTIAFVLSAAQMAAIRMPLLAVLMMSEFGFLVGASGAIVAIKHQIDHGVSTRYVALAVACLVPAIFLGITGYQLWVSINA